MLWAPLSPLAIAAVTAELAIPLALDPQDERTELTRAVTPQRAPVAAASAIALLAVLMVIAVAIGAQREREADALPAKRPHVAAAVVHDPGAARPALAMATHAPVAAAVDRVAAGARTTAATDTSPAGPAPARIASRIAAEQAATVARDGATAGHRRAPFVDRAVGDPVIATAVASAGREPTTTVPEAVPPTALPPTPPTAAAVATQPIASAPRPGVLPLPTAPPASVDSASVAQLYAAIGVELRALDQRRGAAADLWPVYLRIRINEAMADRDMREDVDAQLHRLHAQIVKRGDVHCETPPH